MDNRAAEQYLASLFGARQGHVAVAYKDKDQSWQEHQFAWPADKRKLIAWAEIHQDANVFICPALRQDPHTRKKGDGKHLQWLWADVDWQSVPANKKDEVRSRIAELATVQVKSGTGENVHVYVQLTAPVDAATFAKLNTGLRDYLYADNKQADNSLLRLPGTMNWKTDKGSPVTLEPGRGKQHSSAVLMRRRAFRDAKVPQDVDATDWQFSPVEGLSRRLRAKLNMPVAEAEGRYGSRHDAVFATVKDLHRAQFDNDQIHTMLHNFPAGLSKMAEENGYDLHLDIDRCLARIVVIEEEVEQILEADDDMPEVSEEDMVNETIDEGVAKELLRRAIKRAADQAEALRGHTEPPPDTSQSLSDALSMPPSPAQYLIQDMASEGSLVVIVGQYKTGKTKLMVASLITSLADGEPFLGKYDVPHEGVVVGHWNLEMSALDLIDKYMRPAGYQNAENVHLANWQGYRVNIMTVPGKAMALEWLKSRNVQVWTIDSWSALCRTCGVDPNDGAAVGQLLEAIQEIKVEAGLRGVFMLAHIARANADNERPGTKGASEVDAVVDTRWMLTVDKSDVRFMQVEGRGTQVPGFSLDFDEDTGRSTVGAVSRQSAAADGWVQTVVAILKNKPDGLNKTSLVKQMQEVRKIGIRSAGEYIKEAVESGFVEAKERPRAGRAEQVYILAGMDRPQNDRVRRATPAEVNLSGVRLNGRASK